MGLVDADPLPYLVAYLAAHPGIVDAFGSGDRVGVGNAPPYPRIRLIDSPGGSLRAGRWLIAPAFQLEVLDDLTSPIGRAALRELWLLTVEALVAIPDQLVPTGGPVITDVTATGGGGWSPTGERQPRYVQTITVHAHPRPVDVAPPVDGGLLAARARLTARRGNPDPTGDYVSPTSVTERARRRSL